MSVPEFSFPRYLTAKQTVDDRALHPTVWNGFAHWLQTVPIPRLLDIGAGSGGMLLRLLERGALACGEYTGLDESCENIAAAWRSLAEWGAASGCRVTRVADGAEVRLPAGRLAVRFVQANLFDYLDDAPEASWDALLANAFLDLVDLPASLPRLLRLACPGGRFLFTINFDGETIFEPPVDPALDAQILDLYHRSMEARTPGASRTGRRLLACLPRNGYEILAAGSSDWLVYAQNGFYPADEAYFLDAILHFFEQSLCERPELDPERFAGWLAQRRAQVARGELVYIAHQLDFLAARPTP